MWESLSAEQLTDLRVDLADSSRLISTFIMKEYWCLEDQQRRESPFDTLYDKKDILQARPVIYSFSFLFAPENMGTRVIFIIRVSQTGGFYEQSF